MPASFHKVPVGALRSSGDFFLLQFEFSLPGVKPSVAKPGKYYVSTATDEYYAQGILNQFLYVDPTQNLIVVRLGKKWDNGYKNILRGVSRELAVMPK